jgi:DNA-binding transcriptional regulator YiaG
VPTAQPPGNGRPAALTGEADPPVLTSEEDMTDQERTRWTKLVAHYEASELTQREFAAERGISLSNLRNWIYRLRKESRPALVFVW